MSPLYLNKNDRCENSAMAANRQQLQPETAPSGYRRVKGKQKKPIKNEIDNAPKFIET